MRTLTTIRKIADPEKRAKAAADLVHEARQRAEEARQRRDLAALVMIEPFVRAVAASNVMQAEARDAYYGYYSVGERRYAPAKPQRRKDGTRWGKPWPQEAQRYADETGQDIIWHDPTIDDATYQHRLAAARERREADLAKYNVTVYPAEVYSLIGVARTLFVRMMARMPDDLPHLDDPEGVAKAAVKEAHRYDRIAAEAVEVRDDAIDALFYSRGAQPGTNAYIARLTGLTTARVAQLRLGTR